MVSYCPVRYFGAAGSVKQSRKVPNEKEEMWLWEHSVVRAFHDCPTPRGRVCDDWLPGCGERDRYTRLGSQASRDDMARQCGSAVGIATDLRAAWTQGGCPGPCAQVGAEKEVAGETQEAEAQEVTGCLPYPPRRLGVNRPSAGVFHWGLI